MLRSLMCVVLLCSVGSAEDWYVAEMNAFNSTLRIEYLPRPENNARVSRFVVFRDDWPIAAANMPGTQRDWFSEAQVFNGEVFTSTVATNLLVDGHYLGRHNLVGVPILGGDTDFDGDVDFADFLVLSANFGTQETNLIDRHIGDFDGGLVAFSDFPILSNNFGTTATTAASVPEPSGLCMLLVGAAAFAMARKAKR